MNLMEQVKEIFKETVTCGNCEYHGEDCYCSRIEELFGVEVRTAKDSTCICLDGFKVLPEEDEDEDEAFYNSEIYKNAVEDFTYCVECPASQKRELCKGCPSGAPVRVVTERTYCQNCEDFDEENGICLEAYYKNEENYRVSKDDYCDTETKWYAE